MAARPNTERRIWDLTRAVTQAINAGWGAPGASRARLTTGSGMRRARGSCRAERARSAGLRSRGPLDEQARPRGRSSALLAGGRASERSPALAKGSAASTRHRFNRRAPHRARHLLRRLTHPRGTNVGDGGSARVWGDILSGVSDPAPGAQPRCREARAAETPPHSSARGGRGKDAVPASKTPHGREEGEIKRLASQAKS